MRVFVPSTRPVLIERAQELRRDATAAERRLWTRLRLKQVGGWRFRRQHPVPPYVLDFACIEAMLAVEADGDQHAGSEHDVRRDRFLGQNGWRLLRFWNHEILSNTDGVIETIYYELSVSPLPTLPRKRGRRRAVPLTPVISAPPPPLAGEGWEGG